MFNKFAYKLNKILIKEKKKEVLFLSNYESNFEKNISHFFYNKSFLNLNSKFSKQIKAILKAEIVYIDEYVEAIDYLDKDKVIIYTPRHIFNYVDTLNEKEIKQFEKYTYITSSSKIQTNIFIKKYNVDKSKILEIGCPFVDYLYTHKFTEDVEDLFKSYPDALIEYNILYNPSNICVDIDKQINFINYITSKLPENYKLYTTIDPKYAERITNCTIIDNKEISCFTKLANLVILDFDNSLFEAAFMNKNVILYQYNQKEIKELYSLNFKEIDVPYDVFTKQDDVLSSILSNKYRNDSKLFDKKYNEFNKWTSSREVVVNTFEEYKGE